MASLCFFMVALGLIGSLISPAQALTCSSQKFENRVFANCDDLPHLGAFLHWTYNSKNSSLSVAFQASPPRTGGWVAWAINPTATGMAGAQALVAFLDASGVPTVRTFNISSYSSVVPSPLSFDVWDLAADHSDGKFKIFAKVKLPAKAKSVNHVWQVGPAVDLSAGVPSVHEFKPANLNSRDVLEFNKSSASPAPRAHSGASGLAPETAPASAPSAEGGNGTAAAAAAPGPDKGGDAGIRSRNLGLVVGLFVLIWGIII